MKKHHAPIMFLILVTLRSSGYIALIWDLTGDAFLTRLTAQFAAAGQN